MNYRMKSSVILLFLIDVILIVFTMMINSINLLSFISIIKMVIEFIILWKKNGRFICLSNLFILLSYILHMGNLVSVCLLKYNNNYILSNNYEKIRLSIVFFMLCHFFFVLGNYFCKDVKYKITEYNILTVDYNTLEIIGWLCLIIGIVPRIYIDCTQISLQVNGDYLDALKNLNTYGIVGILALFFYVGVVIVLYTSNNNPIRAKIIFLLTIIWEVISMMSGGRIYAISLIVVMFYIYCIRIAPPKFRTIMTCVVVAIGMSIVMSIISVVRDKGGFDIGDITRTLKGGMTEKNPIIGFISEMGGTMQSVIYAIQDFPEYSRYAFGKTYIETIVSVIPFIGEKIVNINDLIYINNFQNPSYLGGSWIGEAYFNFSWMGCVVCFFIGKAVYLIEKKIVSDNNGNYATTMCCLACLFYIIRYSRDYFYGFSQAIQICLVLLVVSVIIKLVKKGMTR